MKLFSIVITARQALDDQSEIRINPFLILHETGEMVIEEAQQTARDLFPSEEGWEEHQVVCLEIEQGMTFDDGHRLTWQVEKPKQDTEVSNG